MKIGIIKQRLPETNIFIVDVGWGQLRYFVSNRNYTVGDIVLFDLYYSYLNEEEDDGFYETREAWLKGEGSAKTLSDSNKVYATSRLKDCEFLGNVNYDFHHPNFSNSNIVIARKDAFVYWEGCSTEDDSYTSGPVHDFDLVSNSLLFLSYATPRYPFPDEKEWLKAYTYARNKVEDLDIPKMIDELKVEYHQYSSTRRGSDNVIISHYEVRYTYGDLGNYSDGYLDRIFPKYKEALYNGKDDECEYIHPKYEEGGFVRKPDGSIEYKKPRFDGMDMEEYCANKTKELRQLALKNYESYNKDEHINYIAYHHINWYYINKEDKLFQRMKALADIIWGFDYHKLLEQINKYNYQELIQNNNAIHPIPKLPNEECIK